MKYLFLLLASITLILGFSYAKDSWLATFLTILASGYLLLQWIVPQTVYRVPAPALAATARLMRGSGPPLATTRCSGRIGWLDFRGPLLHVTVYPAGIVIAPLLLTSFALPLTEIRTVSRWEGWRGPMFDITHTSSQVASPVQITCRRESPVARIFDGLAECGTHLSSETVPYVSQKEV